MGAACRVLWWGRGLPGSAPATVWCDTARRLGTGLGGEEFRCICPSHRRLVASLVDGCPPPAASALMAIVDAAVAAFADGVGPVAVLVRFRAFSGEGGGHLVRGFAITSSRSPDSGSGFDV